MLYLFFFSFTIFVLIVNPNFGAELRFTRRRKILQREKSPPVRIQGGGDRGTEGWCGFVGRFIIYGPNLSLLGQPWMG